MLSTRNATTAVFLFMSYFFHSCAANENGEYTWTKNSHRCYGGLSFDMNRNFTVDDCTSYCGNMGGCVGVSWSSYGNMNTLGDCLSHVESNESYRLPCTRFLTSDPFKLVRNHDDGLFPLARIPTRVPISKPTVLPTRRPTCYPSKPPLFLTKVPTRIPSVRPTIRPSAPPSVNTAFCDLSKGLSNGAYKTFTCNQDNVFAVVCSWKGVVCSRSQVSEISFKNFIGTIPQSIGSLTSLTSLDFGQTSTLKIPTTIGQLVNLLYLNLASLSLSSLPSSLSSLTNLQRLDISSNRLSGALSSTILGLTKLTSLNLRSNKLTSTAISKLSSMKNLQQLDISSNSLTGSIPSVVFSLTSVTSLSLANNRLRGSIPTAISVLSSLSSLALTGNGFDGSIPTAIGTMSSLTLLSLQSNSFTGAIPSSVLNLTNMVVLSLCDNSFTGTIPTNLSSMALLQLLDLGYNSLRGAVPASIGSLTAARLITLGSNSLTGSIPSELQGLTLLTALSLSRNSLTSSIPTAVGLLRSLRSLTVTSNSLTGVIPTTISSLQLLSQLWLSGNKLRGSLPSEMRFMTSLQHLYLSSNALTGVIPADLSNLPNLGAVILAGNKLTGTIPSSVTRLQNLQYVFLSSNAMTGVLPTALCAVTTLKTWRLDDNNMRCVPDCFFGKLSFTVDFLHNAKRCSSGISRSSISPIPDSPTQTVDTVIVNPSPDKGNLRGIALTPSLEMVVTSPPTTRPTRTPSRTPTSSPTTPTSRAICDMISAMPLLKSKNWNCATAGMGSCYWTGVTCANGMITQIALPQSSLVGTIPDTIGLLTCLQSLDLGKNAINGFMPSGLGNLVALTRLVLAGNKLTGTLPTQLGNVLKLKMLDVGDNAMSGVVPSSMCALTALTSLVAPTLQCREPCSSGYLPQTLPVCSPLLSQVVFVNSFYTAYSTSSIPQSPLSANWNKRDFCSFYSRSKCSQSDVQTFLNNTKVKTCPPVSLQSSPVVYCQTFSLFALGCFKNSSQSISNVNQLTNSCLAAYDSLTQTQTLITLTLQFNITGIDTSVLRAALADPMKVSQAKSLIAAALAASTGLPVDTMSITDIIVLVQSTTPTRRGLVHGDSSALGIASISLSVITTAERDGMGPGNADSAVASGKYALKSAFSTRNSSDSPFAASLKLHASHRISGYFLLTEANTDASFVTAQTQVVRPTRVRARVDYSKTYAPTASPASSPQSF